MSAEDLHEVQFQWPHPEPNTVIVTGTFDDWSSSIYLTKTPAGFEGTTNIPWGEKIKFKFVVDGKWIVHEDQPTEIDPGGFVNNVYNAPPHPSNAEVAEPVIEDVQPTANGHHANGRTLVAKIVENPAEEPAGESAADDKPIEDLAKAEDRIVADTEHQGTDISPSGFPQLLSDLANTIVARDGTSSALDYVASGLGAVMHGVVGMDPINIQKVAIPTPISDEGFTLSRGQESVPVTAELAPDSVRPAVNPDIPVFPLAPRVPITIVPVNAAENNTISSSPPAAEISSPIPIIEAGPVVVVTEPSPTAPAGPQIKSEVILAPVVEADTQLSTEVEQGKGIKVEMPTEDTVGIPVLLEVDSVATAEPETFSSSKGPEPILSATGPEPVRAATESVTVPVAAEPAVEPETTTATEAIPKTAATEADVPTATKAQPESSSTATESTTEPTVTPAATEPFPATTKATPVPDETTAVREPQPQQITVPLHKPEIHAEGKSIALASADVFAPIESSTAVAAPVSDVVHVVKGLSVFDVPEPGPGSIPVDVAPLVEVLKAEDAPAIVVEEPAVEELVEANIVKDEIPAPVVGHTSPVAVNETLVPEPNPPTSSIVEATTVEQVKVTDTPIVVKGKKVTGGEYAAVVEPAVEEEVADAKLEEIKPNPEPIIEPVTTTVVENSKPVESLSVVQRSLRESAPPTAVVAAVEAHAPLAANEPMTHEPSPIVDEVALTKEHGQANGSTTSDPGARISTDGQGALPAATTSTREAVTHAEKFPSASVSHPVSEDNTPSSSKFSSTRKKRASLFGKLKNIFHQDKEKEKK